MMHRLYIVIGLCIDLASICDTSSSVTAATTGYKNYKLIPGENAANMNEIPKFNVREGSLSPVFGGFTSYVDDNNAGLRFAGKILSEKDEEDIYALLLMIDFEWTYYIVDGEPVRSPRKMAWFAEDPSATYQFSKNHVPGLRAHDIKSEANGILSEIKALVEKLTSHSFNAILVNIYEDGSEHSAWHSDDDPWLGDGSDVNVASLSFGATRDFHWRSKADNNTTGKIPLTSGSLVEMTGCFQQAYQHSVPETNSREKYRRPRINLTFRHIIDSTLRPVKATWGS